ARAVFQLDLRADNQWQLGRTRGLQRADDPCETAFIGHGQRGITQRLGAREQFSRTGYAAQEGQVREAVEFSVWHVVRHGSAEQAMQVPVTGAQVLVDPDCLTGGPNGPEVVSACIGTIPPAALDALGPNQ